MAENHLDYEKILEIIIAFNGETNYYNLLETILKKIMEFTHADGGTLYVRSGNQLFFRIVRTNSQNKYISAREENNMPPITLDENNIKNVSAYAAIKNQVVVIDDVYENTSFNFEGPKNYDKMTGYRTQSMCVLPLSTTKNNDATEVIGVIQLLNATDPATGKVVPFQDVFDPPVLPSIASASASVLANILYTQEIKDLFNSFIKVMAKTIDERTPYNKNHTVNVAAYCERFALFLSQRFREGDPLYFSDNRREQLVMAAMLHDIGKITTPLKIMDKADRLGSRAEAIDYKFQIKQLQLRTELLEGCLTQAEYQSAADALTENLALIHRVNKSGFLPDADLAAVQSLSALRYTDQSGQEVPMLTESELTALSIRKGTLTDSERQIMQEHVSVTGRLLDEMSFPNYYSKIPLWAARHHEYLDGSGYPNGISGAEITPEISILTITDIFDALTASDRPYKRVTPIPKALDILSEMAEEGKFPKELVALFRESKAWEA